MMRNYTRPTSDRRDHPKLACEWQPIRWIPVQAIVDVCDASGFIAAARLTRVGAPLTFLGRPLADRPTHWRWRHDSLDGR